jgi:hypothetical protein
MRRSATARQRAKADKAGSEARAPDGEPPPDPIEELIGVTP